MTRRGLRRRSGALPSVLRSERERREYLIALGVVAVLQLAIAVSLAVSAAQTYRMWRQDVPYVPAEAQRMIPAALALGAAIALFGALRSLGRVRSMRRMPVEPAERE